MNKKNILVTGGAGYIGSHMVQKLLENDYNPIVFDNLSGGKKEFVPADVTFIEGDLLNKADLENVFTKFNIAAVMHFAGLISVGESVSEPKKYQENNVVGGCNLLEAMGKHNVKRLIFSSTAAVYDFQQDMPLTENSKLGPKNPYGQTKLDFENIIKQQAKDNGLNFIIFRYFNAGGSLYQKNIGESHNPETHLIPNILRSLKGPHKFYIFGTDYPTTDGTCVRDYVHVIDICQAHLLGLKNLFQDKCGETFNIGTGVGFTVKEVIDKAEIIVENKINYIAEKRRAGDADILVASFEKARKVLGWEPKHSIDEIIKSAFLWEKQKDKLNK